MVRYNWTSAAIQHIIIANICEVAAYLLTITGIIWWIDHYYPSIFSIQSFPIYQMYIKSASTSSSSTTPNKTPKTFPSTLTTSPRSLHYIMIYYLSILFPESFKLILIALLLFDAETHNQLQSQQHPMTTIISSDHHDLSTTSSNILLLLSFHGLLFSIQVCSLRAITNLSWAQVSIIWGSAMFVRCLMKSCFYTIGELYALGILT